MFDILFYYHWLRKFSSEYLLEPIYLHGFSSALHLVLLIVLLVSLVNKMLKARGRNTQILTIWTIRFFCYRLTLCICLGLSFFYLVLLLLNQFFWNRNGWSKEKTVFALGLLSRTISWFAIPIYLHIQSSSSHEPKYPFVLRLWWSTYLSISCYCLVIDFIYQIKHPTLPFQFWVSDVVSSVVGVFLCYVGYSVKQESEDDLLHEHLLNDSVGVSPGRESNNCSGDKTVTPYSNASVFSILTFSWMDPLIASGYKKALDLEDVPQLSGADSAHGAFPIFKDKLQSEIGRNSQATTVILVKALIFTTWREILLTALLAILYTFACYVGPYLIDSFVQYLYGNQEYKNEGYVLVSAFFIAKLVECLTQRHWFFKLEQVGIRARSALTAMIYNKGLALSCQSKQGHTSGEIINFMTVDAERIGDFCGYMHDPWRMFLQIALALWLLYKNLGLASLATFAATIIVTLANVPLGNLIEKYQDKLMESKDKRMKATSEILRNMRILKLQGWEMKFLSKILELRKIEAGWLRRYMYTFAISSFVFWIAPTFVSVVTFGTCMLIGIPFQTGKILSALATFRALQEPISDLPETVAMIMQTKVSLDRIASFLCLDELKTDVVEKLPRSSSDIAIEAVGGNFAWDVSSPVLTLNDINFRINHGMTIAICGTVGSGKSSLLSCILGEMPKISGTIKLSGTKAYVAQLPWIQSGNIEENILFGKKMDKERYVKILEACSLEKDLEILPFGDQTVIGERGINLSGGQKQRIQIARALYQDADIYLFDDPFSAVDTHTGTHLFQECILGILNSKTVLFVTHQVEFLPAADLILVMKDGTITQVGKYDDILNSGTDFMDLVGAHKEALVDCVEGITVAKNLNVGGKDTNLGRFKESASEEEAETESQIRIQDYVMVQKGQLVQEEEREKGGVGFSVYWRYITASYGGALVPLISLAQVLFQVLQIGSNYWITWATPISESDTPPVGVSTLLIVYSALAIGSTPCIFARSLLTVIAGYKTATLLFNRMHFCIFRAPMSFFDATPSGRILNRASTDQSAVDLNISYLVGAFAFSTIQLLGVIAVMSQVAWQVFIIFIPVTTICIWLQQYYISSARELSRLIGVCKAPIIQHFAETISGLTTIRSFDHGSRFQETNMKLVDGYIRPRFNSCGAMEWLCFRMEILSSIVLVLSLVFLISVPEGAIDPSIAGLAVTYGLNLNVLLGSFIWNLSNMENRIISVERILQYTCIPSEPPLIVEARRPDHNWPSHGEVDISNLQVRYTPQMPLVLRGLTCTFSGGQKTGIVGRTGCGKSTLIQTLFRVVEPATGQILIDGVNICSIGLHDLRSRLSIIPQDPTLFEGTIRSNLDPLQEYTDEQIWEALDKCQLGDEIRKKDGNLDTTVTENGENWSLGQRQLLCLGRVLLKRSKILVLDEATSSVDTITDNMIQQTIKQHFIDSTVITIAHRITSVLDSDMVLLLDDGLIKEHDSPIKLLENKSSLFSNLVAEYSMRSKHSFDKLANK